jgi:hypothetical protein
MVFVAQAAIISETSAGSRSSEPDGHACQPLASSTRPRACRPLPSPSRNLCSADDEYVAVTGLTRRKPNSRFASSHAWSALVVSLCATQLDDSSYLPIVRCRRAAGSGLWLLRCRSTSRGAWITGGADHGADRGPLSLPVEKHLGARTPCAAWIERTATSLEPEVGNSPTWE